MRLGCCVEPDMVANAASAGYDFAELPVAAVRPEEPEAVFASARDAVLAAAAKPEAWRLLLPPDLKVAGPNVDWPRVARYVYTALRRIGEVGGSVVVFGSGTAREAPAGFGVGEALDQITEFLRVAGTVARSRALMVGIEPLSATTCNIINSLPEAVALARAVNMPEVGVVADARQMALEDQSPFDVVDAAEWLVHVHVPPAPDPDAPAGAWLREFVDALRMADYDWRISVEPGPDDGGEDIGAALEWLREAFSDADGVTSSHG